MSDGEEVVQQSCAITGKWQYALWPSASMLCNYAHIFLLMTLLALYSWWLHRVKKKIDGIRHFHIVRDEKIFPLAWWWVTSEKVLVEVVKWFFLRFRLFLEWLRVKDLLFYIFINHHSQYLFNFSLLQADYFPYKKNQRFKC